MIIYKFHTVGMLKFKCLLITMAMLSTFLSVTVVSSDAIKRSLKKRQQLVCSSNFNYQLNCLPFLFQPLLELEVRQKLWDTAVRAAKAVGYVGAG